jgi:hypothetical protein
MSLHRAVWHKTDNLGRLRDAEVIFEVKDGRIIFIRSDYAFKDAIKAMRGSKYHGYDTKNPRRIWSVEDCHRNWMSIRFLAGEDIYSNFDRELERHEYKRPLMPHQCDLTDAGLTYHYQIWAAEMGVGKTLSAQEVIERSGHQEWWWIGPKTSLPNIQREFRKWSFPFGQFNVELMTYEGLKRRMDNWKPGDLVPIGVIFDESSKLKTWTAQRTQAAAKLADLIRSTHGANGFVILMSGTPSPKTPVDWWAQAEIAWPGFLAEGSDKAFRARLSFMKLHQFDSGVAVNKVEGWRDDERKCNECGELAEHLNHQAESCEDPTDYHEFKPSVNEVALLPRRLKGLVVIKHKKDCLSLPDKRYRHVYCKPHPSTLRVAQALANAAPNAVTGMTLLRELSDGFLYRDVQAGTTRCTHCSEGKIAEWTDSDNLDRVYRSIDILDLDIVARLQKTEITCPACNGSQAMPKYVRETNEVPCPKDKALKSLLEENEEQGRLVVFAGFTGSVDRCVRLCQEEAWDVVRCDGRGYRVTTHKGEIVADIEPLDYWADLARFPRVVFVAHPESGGMSLTLTEARMAVYWSNSWKPEYRVQSEDRLHRLGTDLNKGVLIVDLIHLPSDERVLEVIRANRRLELMTMGEVMGDIDWENPKGMDDEMLTVDVAA